MAAERLALCIRKYTQRPSENAKVHVLGAQGCGAAAWANTGRVSELIALLCTPRGQAALEKTPHAFWTECGCLAKQKPTNSNKSRARRSFTAVSAAKAKESMYALFQHWLSASCVRASIFAKRRL